MHAKWYETHQNMCLGSNGVDRVRSLRKNSTQLCGTNFCTSLARFALTFARLQNSSKFNQMVRNAPKHEFRVQCGGSGAFVAKNSDATNFCISSACFPSSFASQPNGPKCIKQYETRQNMSLGSNGVDRVHSLRKIPKCLRDTGFCTSLARFTSSFFKATKRSQMHPNSTKHIKT